MARLTARILKLERLLPTGIEAELRALTNEKLVARIAELSGVTVEEARTWTPEESLRLQGKIRAAITEG